MFFIVNCENSIIASDTAFLDAIGASDIFVAASLISREEVKINEYESTLSYFGATAEYTKIPLTTFFGEAYLYQLNIEDKEQESHKTQFELDDSSKSMDESEIIKQDKEETNIPLTGTGIGITGLGIIAKTITDDNIENKIPKLENEELLENSTSTENNLEDEIKIYNLGDTQKTPEETDIDEIVSTTTVNKEPAQEYHKEYSDEENSKEAKDTHYSSIDIARIAKLIGISEKEYAAFLDDFQSESRRLEFDLKSHDLKTSKEAISILKEASLLLHLPHLSEKLTELANATSDEKEDIANDYLEMVAQPSLITKTKSEHSFAIEHALKENASEQEDSMGNITPATNNEEEIASDNTFDLDSVKVIPLDFSINKATNELALPSSLVSEFIVNFIDQAKENLPILQKAYNDKDIDMLQNTAHMLKGASSNLRITPIAETLYELQFNTELERVPRLIKLFAGQLKSLDHQMNQ